MNEVEPNYEDIEVKCLATEAIQKVRKCIDESALEIEFPVSSNQYIPSLRLEVLGSLVEWKIRYLSKLGRIKQFMLSYPFCSQHFVLQQDESNTGSESFVVFEKPNVNPVDIMGSSIMSNETSISTSTERDVDEYSMIGGDTVPTEGELKNLSKKAIDVLRSILITCNKANPVHSMGLSTLNAVSRWALRFNALGSMKKWILQQLPDLSLDHRLFLIHGDLPGTDVVQWRWDNASSPGRAVDNSSPKQQQQQHRQQFQQQSQQKMSYNPHPPAPPPLHLPTKPRVVGLLRESSNTINNTTTHSVDSGVNIRDFFHIPLIPNSTETSYQKSTLKTTEMFANFVRTGALRSSLYYGKDIFDELEWRGDAVLHLEITNIQCACHASLYDVGGLSQRRSDAEQRLTLALLFDDFQLAQFVKICPDSWTRDLWKVKGDFLEAMIGELYMRLNDSTEEGLPFGHADRRTAMELIKRIAQAALERGSMLQSVKERKQLTAAAEAAGGGGLLVTLADQEAMKRCSSNNDH